MDIQCEIKRKLEVSETNDKFQVDYLPDEKKIKINLPEEVWKNIDTVIMTRLFQEELVVEKQKESEEVNLETLFYVIDKKTGKEPNLERIALTEDWAKDLVFCDIEGFLLSEYGDLILADECGNWVYCPPDRFEVRLLCLNKKGRGEGELP